MKSPLLVDLAAMPEFNGKTGSHGLHSVSEGRVYWDPKNKVSCHLHRAMNAVNADRTIWRCLNCGEGAYVFWDPDLNDESSPAGCEGASRKDTDLRPGEPARPASSETDVGSLVTLERVFPNCQLCGNPVSFELWDGERVCECRGTRLTPKQLAEYLVEREDFISTLADSAGIAEVPA